MELHPEAEAGAAAGYEGGNGLNSREMAHQHHRHKKRKLEGSETAREYSFDGGALQSEGLMHHGQADHLAYSSIPLKGVNEVTRAVQQHYPAGVATMMMGPPPVLGGPPPLNFFADKGRQRPDLGLGFATSLTAGASGSTSTARTGAIGTMPSIHSISEREGTYLSLSALQHDVEGNGGLAYYPGNSSHDHASEEMYPLQQGDVPLFLAPHNVAHQSQHLMHVAVQQQHLMGGHTGFFPSNAAGSNLMFGALSMKTPNAFLFGPTPGMVPSSNAGPTSSYRGGDWLSRRDNLIPTILSSAGDVCLEPTALVPSSEDDGTGNALSGRRPTTLFMYCDADNLSEYQCLVREQIEIFEARQPDVESNAKGRNKPIVLGQVGIRCRHCTQTPPKQRARGAMYYPAKLNGLYQAAQSMASGHLCFHCKQIPPGTRQELLFLRERKSSAGGGKMYWGDGVQVLGAYEDDHGLRFKR